MHLREVRGPGRELDPLGRRDQRGLKHHAVGDGLAGVGEMLAHEGVVEPELIGENDGLAVLLERLDPITVHGVHRHGEVAQSHSRLQSRAAAQALGAAPKRLMCPIYRAGTSINLRRGACVEAMVKPLASSCHSNAEISGTRMPARRCPRLKIVHDGMAVRPDESRESSATTAGDGGVERPPIVPYIAFAWATS